ncbi:MAG: M48 family metallopeptidase [Thiolinea sp.]
MDNYRNPQPPEGINTSPDHPLLTFIKLLAGMALVLVIAAWILGNSAGWLASLVPFEQELRVSELYPESETQTSSRPELQAYLDDLAGRLQTAMELPEGMQIKLHYQPDDVENAFATLGGNIILYKGLLKALPNENSLAMLIAHEMAHVKFRHPIRAASQGLAINAGIKLLMGYSNVDILGNTGLYTQLHFSRAMETDSDIQGLSAVHSVYGHVTGATDLFATLHKLTATNGLAPKSAFFSTHPLDQDRIDKINQIAAEKGWTHPDDQLTPLPAEFMSWLEEE